MAIAPGGDIILSTSTDLTNNGDIVTYRYAPSGSLVWSAVFNGTGNAPDTPFRVHGDAAGNTFVSGMTMSQAPWTGCLGHRVLTARCGAVRHGL